MYHVKRKLLAIVLSLIMVFSLVPSNLAFAAEGAYIHNPMDNPKTAADIIEDPAAVYGYRPNPDSVRLGEFANAIDWTDEKQVAEAREQRAAYHAKNEELYKMIDKLSAEGKTTEEIARTVSKRRNELRLEAYNGDPEGLARVKKSNLDTYGNENGPTADSLYEKYGSWQTVLEKALSTNAGMDACLGFYDTYYSLYGAEPAEKKYFGKFSMPQTNFNDIKYERFGMAEFDKNISEILKINLKPYTEENAKAMKGLLETLSEQYWDSVSRYALAQIDVWKHNSEENIAELEKAFNIVSEAGKNYTRMYTELAEGKYRSVPAELFGSEDEFEAFLDSNGSDKYYELVAEEQKLISDFTANIYGNNTVISDSGEKLNISDITAKMNAADEAMKNGGDTDVLQAELEMLENKYLEYTKKNNIILGEIYSKLVKVRDKIAGETVYENYAEYAYEIGYARDYTVAEAQSFSGYVKKHIVPLYEKVGDAIANLDTRYLSMTDEEILEELKFCFADVSGEMSDAFMYMLDKNMYDITYSEDKYPSYAATIYLYNLGTPFLFASPSEDNADQLGTVIHEFGHFNTMLYDPVNQENNIGTLDASNMDTAEVNSLGLETLMTNYYNRFYGKDENAYTLSLIYYLLGNIIDGCVINEFELAAIKNPNMSVDELNRTYRKIGESYGMTFMTDDEMAYGWVRIQHIFTQPFYYISYATSSMAALDIWSGIDDFDVAKDRYLKFCALGDHIPFKEALSEVGIHNVFEEKCSIILAEQITEEFGFDYEDVKHDEWYYNAVFFSLPYVDGLSDVEYGINQNASRGIIATGIAGLCRGENVESKAKFTDIPANNKVYINWAYDNGIIYGYDDTLFGYSDDVTREQAVVMLYRCAEFLGTDNSEASSQIIYTDADAVSDWAVEAVSWASSIGIIRGYEDGAFKPFNNVTKAEFAQMLYAFADVVH